MGRPTIRTPELEDRIVAKLDGGASFRWFDSDEAREAGFPSRETISRWRQADDGFEAKCMRACEAQAEADYDRMEEIEERVLLKPSDPQHLDSHAANVALSNMRWRMEKRKPSRYGQKVKLEASLTLESLVGASIPQQE